MQKCRNVRRLTLSGSLKNGFALAQKAVPLIALGDESKSRPVRTYCRTRIHRLREKSLWSACLVILLRCCRCFAQTPRASGKLFPGAGEGIRTPDPLITNQMLYQLSYASKIGLPALHGRKRSSHSLPDVRDNFLSYHNGIPRARNRANSPIPVKRQKVAGRLRDVALFSRPRPRPLFACLSAREAAGYYAAGYYKDGTGCVAGSSRKTVFGKPKFLASQAITRGEGIRGLSVVFRHGKPRLRVL